MKNRNLFLQKLYYYIQNGNLASKPKKIFKPMILSRKLFYSVGVSSFLFLSGCALSQMVKMAKEQELTVVPSPLEVHGDSVRFEVSAALPAKMLKKNKIYAVQPFYTYGDEKIQLETVEFNANDFPDAKTAQPKLSHTFSFAYNPNIGNGDLSVVGTASNLAKTKSKSTQPMTIAQGLIRTSRLVQDIAAPVYADHGYNTKEELMPVNVNFYFDQGSSRLRTSEVRTSGKTLDAFIAQKNATRTVTIIGQHSPEGPERVNTQLAEQRAKVIEDFYKKAMGRYDYKGMADSIKFVTKGVVQDWQPLKRLMDTTDILTADQEQQVNQIVSGAGSYEEKAKQLQQLPFYKTLLNELFPRLRVAKTEILVVKPKKSEAEIALLAKAIIEGNASADTLSAEELSFAASLTESLDEKVKIYQALIKQTDSWAAHNNLAATYLEMAKKEIDPTQKSDYVTKAMNHLQIALKKEDNAVAATNQVAAFVLKGMKTEARQAAEKAASLNPERDTEKKLMAMKGTLEIKDAKYSEAVQSLSKAQENYEVLFNLALANLLKGDLNAAQNGFKGAINVNPEGELAYYGGAVTAARKADEGAMLDMLKKAVQLEQTLAQKAQNDLEFRNYWASENFKNALK